MRYNRNSMIKMRMLNNYENEKRYESETAAVPFIRTLEL